MYNPTRVLSALDEAASSILRFKSGRIMDIQHHAFRTEVVQGIDVFKIPNLRVSPTYLSQRFVDAWTSAKLRGLTFEPVWSG